MTRDEVKSAADILSRIERIEYGRRTFAIRACGEDIAALIDEDAVARIRAVIDEELSAVAEAMRKQLAELGVA
jgi:hypothetical protein